MLGPNTRFKGLQVRIEFHGIPHNRGVGTPPGTPAGRFSKFGGDLRSPSHGHRAVARLFRATVRRPCQNAPQGRFFFDADVAQQKRDFHKEVFISIQFKAFVIQYLVVTA